MQLRLLKKQAKKAGLAPGTLVYTGDVRETPIHISLIDYTRDSLEEVDNISWDACLAYRNTASVSWINVAGVHNVELVRQIGEAFEMHPLALEDIVALGQRPKLEAFDEHLFIILKIFHLEGTDQALAGQVEQISLVVGKHYVLSFQELPADGFDAVRERIRVGKGRLRKMDVDYLAYALIDTVVDHYFAVLDHLRTKAELLEEEVLLRPKQATFQALVKLRQELLLFRGAVWPVRDVVSGLQHNDMSRVEDKVKVYLRDVYDHVLQVTDAIDTLHAQLGGMIDLYQSSLSNKMNEVMKFLTIIGTIFIPLGFIAGVYGMNFERMPELHWAYGYPLALVLMLMVSGGLMFYFYKKDWL